MSYIIKRISCDEDIQAYLTEENDYGLWEQAKEFEDYSDALLVATDPPWDDTGEYDYEIEEKKSKRFPGIDWWCDRCGANLNIQVGFDDHHYIWKCRKCGYKNSISADNIIYDI